MKRYEIELKQTNKFKAEVLAECKAEALNKACDMAEYADKEHWDMGEIDVVYCFIHFDEE